MKCYKWYICLLLVSSVIIEYLRFSEIVRDGNCFYRAISLYVYGDQEDYRRVRREIMQYMSERDEYSRLMFVDRSQNYEGYLE